MISDILLVTLQSAIYLKLYILKLCVLKLRVGTEQGQILWHCERQNETRG